MNGSASKVSDWPPEPADYRQDDYRSLVPKTLKGAKVITSNEAEQLIADRSVIFIDVYPRSPKPKNLPQGTLWRDTQHSTIEGAHWMPNVGYGVLSSDIETYFKTRLEKLTDHKKNCSLVFLCQRNCWMSWNAAKRAVSWGYTSVHWFPDGTDGWMMLGNSLQSVDPMP
ncbi:MAG: PQQ-dependent catabolism-associated CXXCW motif protein [Hyphomicrobium sp.]